MKKGFTLVEVLMVLVILVTITVAGTFGIQKIQKKSEETSLKELYSQITTAADVYLSNNDVFAKDILNKEVDEKCIRIYTLQNEGLLSYTLVNPVTNKMIPGNLCVYSYLNEEGVIKNSFSEDTDTKRVTLNVINGSSDKAYSDVHNKASFILTPNDGYELEVVTDTCNGVLSGDTYIVSDVTSDMSCSVTLKAKNLFADGSLGAKMLADNGERATRNDFSTTFIANTTGILYTATEANVHNTSDTTVYYYAGNTTNNWVKFAAFYWRIIRTNADGSVRLLYHGTSTDSTSAYIGTSAFNSSDDDPMYVGYMYGTSGSLANNRTNTNNITIKTEVDKWYSNNMSSYTSYLSTTAVYCNDRSLESGSTYSTTSTFTFAGRGKLYSNKIPTYNCTVAEDAFSGSNTSAKLTYPIGLMTADEVAYAGGRNSTELSTPFAWYYINSAGTSSTDSTKWWLMSPYYWYYYSSSNRNANVFDVNGSGNPGRLSNAEVSKVYGIRPVISIKSDILISGGTGTSTNPYVIN